MIHTTKPKRIITFGALALALFVIPSGAAFGLSYIDLGLLDRGLNTDESTSLEVDSEADSSEANLDIRSRIDLGEDSREGTSSASVDAEGRAELESGIETSARIIEIDRLEFESHDEILPLEVTSGMVNSESSLRAFASSTVSADKRVQSVRFTGNVVELSYSMPGKLFALWPLSYTVEARAHADGSVEVDMPWYRFAVKDGHAELEEELEAVLRETLSVDLGGNEAISSNAGFSARGAAEVASRMHEVFSANAALGASASTDELE